MKKVVVKEGEALVVEKKSKFISYIRAVKTQEEAINFVSSMKKKYFDARHHCYAYKIGDVVKYSDDREPQNTAGKPIYSTIIENDLDEVVIVVIRYFGGILLGTGGLVRAYKEAAITAVKNAKLSKVISGEEFECLISYKDEPYFRRFVEEVSNYAYLKIKEAVYFEKCRLVVVAEDKIKEEFKEKIFDKLNGNVEIEKVFKTEIVLE